MSEKFSFCVNFLKFFGLFLDNFKEPSKKCLKYLKYWPFFAIFIYGIFVLALTLKMLGLLIFNGQFNLHDDYTGIILMVAVHFRALTDLIYTIFRRKSEKKFWNLLNQLDDFIERFLGIKIDQKHENLLFFCGMMLNIVLNIGIGVTLSVFNYSLDDRFVHHRTALLSFITHINMAKFGLYVSILHNRLQLITQNFYNIQLEAYKLHAVPQVYSIIWKLSKILSHRFAVPLMFMTLHVLIITMFFGFLMAQSISSATFTGSRVVSIVMPQVTIWIVCYNCQRINKIVS